MNFLQLERRRYVLFGHEGQWDMPVIGTESSQWCHYNAVLQLQIAQFEGLEEVRRHGCNVLWVVGQFQKLDDSREDAERLRNVGDWKGVRLKQVV